MDCTLCHEPVVLIPSAAERAKKYGGKPSDYTKRFTEHAQCTLKQRVEATHELIRRQQ